MRSGSTGAPGEHGFRLSMVNSCVVRALINRLPDITKLDFRAMLNVAAVTVPRFRLGSAYLGQDVRIHTLEHGYLQLAVGLEARQLQCRSTCVPGVFDPDARFAARSAFSCANSRSHWGRAKLAISFGQAPLNFNTAESINVQR